MQEIVPEQSPQITKQLQSMGYGTLHSSTRWLITDYESDAQVERTRRDCIDDCLEV